MGEERVFAAPTTRRYAREVGVDITRIRGSGPNGRVLRSDVQAVLRGQSERDPPAEADRGWTDAELEPGGEVDVRSLSSTRRTIARNMVRSARTIPHATSVFEADAEALVEGKERLDASADVRVTYTPIFVKAVAAGLQAHPELNATVDEEAGELLCKQYYNVGVAVDTEAGLVVPVIDDVDEKSVVEIAAQLHELVAAAESRELSPEAFSGATFTVSNTGSHGSRSLFGTPIINPPQTGILGISGIRDEPVATDRETVAVRKRVYLSLSYDHRVVDGVAAGGFMNTVIDQLEDPAELSAPE